MQSPREIYLAACAQIGAALTKHGFKFAKSGPHAQRKSDNFSFTISFQSSFRNVAEHYVVLLAHASVRSKLLSTWRAAQPNTLRRDDWVSGAYIGYLIEPHQTYSWNLADAATRPATIASATASIEAITLPFFDGFSDVSSYCERLAAHDMPGMDIPLSIDFLLCFSGIPAAEAALHRFFRDRPSLLSPYHRHLEQLRDAGLHPKPNSGYAFDLAYATIAHSLNPPGNA